MRRQMPGQHHVILVEDGDQRRASQGRAPVPVSRQAEPLGIDLDARPIAGGRANHRERIVVGSVVRDDQLEIDTLLRENAADRLGEMGRAVAGRDGDGQEWARLMGRHASLDLSARRGPVRPEHARFPR